MNAEGMSKWKLNHPKPAAYSNPRPKYCADEFTVHQAEDAEC